MKVSDVNTIYEVLSQVSVITMMVTFLITRCHSVSGAGLSGGGCGHLLRGLTLATE